MLKRIINDGLVDKEQVYIIKRFRFLVTNVNFISE